eukprot:5448472-Pyramimonas_sp.AAC.1
MQKGPVGMRGRGQQRRTSSIVVRSRSPGAMSSAAPGSPGTAVTRDGTMTRPPSSGRKEKLFEDIVANA